MTLLRRLFRRARTPGAGDEAGAAGPGRLGPLARPPTRMVVSGAATLRAAASGRSPARPGASLDPRVRLWRDTAAVLIGIALAVYFADGFSVPQGAVLGETAAPPTAVGTLGPPPTTGSPPSSEVSPDVTSSAPPGTASPTRGPRPTAPPTPAATPTDTPAPTGTPAPTDTPAPTETPTPTETPSPVPPPVAVISVPVTCVAARTLQFDGSGSTGAIDADGYAWDFGDLTNGSGMIVTHDYQGPARTLLVTLTVTGPGGTSMATVPVDVPCQ